MAPAHPPRWVEVGSAGDLAIIIRELPAAVLVRYATRGKTFYHWVDATCLVRRPDMDGRALEPAWLVRARASRRPPLVLHCLLHGLDTREEAAPAPPPFDFDTDADGRPQEGAA